MQPPMLAEAKKGKSFGAIRNFADTFNWLVAFCRNLTGGIGVTVDRTDSDHPIIRLDNVRPANKPFQVRHDATDGFVIYVPDGSVLLPGVTVHLPQATGDWYKIDGAATLASADGTFSVYAHVKARAKGPSDTTIHPAIVATAHGAADNNLPTDASKAGDVACFVVASCTRATAGGVTTYTVAQTYAGAVTHLALPVVRDLELYWTLNALNQPFSASPVVEAGVAPLCGGALSETAISASGAVSVYYVIDCSDTAPAPSVATSASGANDKLETLVYTLNDGCVTTDRREAVNRRVFYP